MESGNEYLRQLEQKAENLSTQARNLGAAADYRFVRRYMLMGRRIRSNAAYMLAISHLEDRIASFNREKERRTSRRPLSFKLKNLISIFGR